MQKYQVQVAVESLNCRILPSKEAEIKTTTTAGQIHNIVAEVNGWGQLENDLWIMLEFTKPLKAEIPEAQKVVEPLPEPKTHKVKKGESLWEIAEMYYGDGNRYVDIKTANELKSDILKTGKVLKIPF